MANKLRAGLIGASPAALRVHYASLGSFQDVELTALAEPSAERRSKVAERLRIQRTYGDYADMLAKEELDAVWVLLPPHQVFDAAVASARRKCHVFTEKPPGLTANQTRMMALACERAGVLGMCGFNRRYIPLIRECRRRVEERGGVSHAVASFYKPGIGEKPFLEGGVDLLTDEGIHSVDLLRWLCGEPEAVAADVQARSHPFPDSFHALLRFTSGATGVLLSQWGVGARVHRLELHGPGISVYVNPDDQALVYTDGKPDPEVLTTQTVAGSDDIRAYYGYLGANRHFVDCIRERKEPSSSLADAALTMDLVGRIYGSSIGPAGGWGGPE